MGSIADNGVSPSLQRARLQISSGVIGDGDSVFISFSQGLGAFADKESHTEKVSILFSSPIYINSEIPRNLKWVVHLSFNVSSNFISFLDPLKKMSNYYVPEIV